MNSRVATRIKEILASRPDLLKSEYQQRDRDHPLEGHCYVASEAYYHALGGKDAGYTPHYVTHEGETHWFLRDGDGEVIDLTAEQFETSVPYNEGRGIGFQTKQPSARAQAVLDELKQPSSSATPAKA